MEGVLFVNRVAELELLEKLHASGKAEFFVLYGRRRVGKTELLAHFCADKRAVFFVADLGSEASLRSALSNAANTVLFGPDQAGAVYSTWEDLFQALGRAAQTERLVVVLDEFPYLAGAHPPIASVLQRIWDRSLKSSLIMLILSGSTIGMMEDTVLGYQAPLYGRRTGGYLLEPFRFQEARLFFESYPPEDQVRLYAVYGGTPAYLQTLRTELSPAENIRDGILTRGAFLYDEARFVLQQELREPRNYFAVLEAIAAGRTRLNEIKQATGIDGAAAYLDTLQQLHLVERRVPVTERQPHKSRRGIYRLRDPYLRFWFRHVHPNRSQLERSGAEIVLKTQVLPQLDLFTGPAFEDVCAQWLWSAGLSGRLPFTPIDVGGWWRANEEVDLVALGETEALLVECKWSAKPAGGDILEGLERKAGLVRPELGDRRILFALCARAGFTGSVRRAAEERSDLLLFDLPAILERWW
ncbi:MAG TPA: ATP-binding protein [Anaerolineales bacterium]|nr:ATP-binding protein [Anaerolineales bacterium]